MEAHPLYEPVHSPEGELTSVMRHGGTVLRPIRPWTPSVHALLRHLEAAGFGGSPRVVGDGHDGAGNEVVIWIDGELVHPYAWSDEGIWRLGGLLRSLHDAVAGFRPAPGAVWQPWTFRAEGDGPGVVVSHGDLGPWNVVARDGLPVAFIDWERAGPIERSDELAQVGWLNAQLHDDDVAERNALPDASARAAQLRRFLDGYGLVAAERAGFVARLIECAIRHCAAVAVEARITPESRDPTPLWGLAWPARSAAWMLRHRVLLERAIGG